MLEEVVLKSKNATASIIPWGASVRDLVVFNKRVVLGFANPADYPPFASNFGAIAGRYANRIRHGQFPLNGAIVQLTKNQENKHHSHGGLNGFSKRSWVILSHTENSVMFALHSPDGDGGYPHDCVVTCRYILLDNALRVELRGFSEGDTLLNLCHHSYFNLSGEATILDHFLKINARHYIPVDSDKIPTGEITPVKNTVFDFQTRRKIRLISHSEQVKIDHSFVIHGSGFREMAALTSPDESMRLTVFSDQVGLQIYDAHKMNTAIIGLDGVPYGNFAGIAFEPHAHPDTPNNPHFGSSLLKKGEVYQQNTEYQFEKNL